MTEKSDWCIKHERLTNVNEDLLSHLLQNMFFWICSGGEDERVPKDQKRKEELIRCIRLLRTETDWLPSTATVVCKNKSGYSSFLKIYYMDVEHMNLTYFNPRYIRAMNVTARRFGRKDPIHYMHVHFETLVPFDNNVLIDDWVYEFLSNEYRRSFVEFHYKFCDLLLHDTLFGPFFTKHLPKTCPLPKGVYHLVNISIPDLPLLGTFPFQKGRLYLNMTLKGFSGIRERLIELYTDTCIKQRWS